MDKFEIYVYIDRILNLITLGIAKFDAKSQSLDIFRGNCQIKGNSYQ